MAVDFKNILADALLQLVEEKPLEKITVRDFMERTGVSRQGFYNHFPDKNALIHWVYVHRVMGDFASSELRQDYPSALEQYYQRVAQHHHFMKEAVQQSGQNSLRDFLYRHPYEWDLNYTRQMCSQYGAKVPEDELMFFARYHSLATVAASIQWILDDMPYAPEEFAKKILRMRTTSLGQFVSSRQDIQFYG